MAANRGRVVNVGRHIIQVVDRDTVDEIKRHFNVVAEELRQEIRLVAESVSAHREETHREFTTVRSAMRDEINEVKALIRLSYVQQRLTSSRMSPIFAHDSTASKPESGTEPAPQIARQGRFLLRCQG